MGAELYAEFVRNADDDITKGRWYSISAACGAPTNVGYRLHGFGDDIERLSEEDRQLWGRAGGIDSFLEFETHGYVSHPDPFAAKAVQLLINPLGSLDRFKFVDSGSLGEGWYDGTTFLIRLYLGFSQTQQLLSIMKAPEFQHQNEVDVLGEFQRDVTGYDPAAVNIRFDLFKVKYQERPKWTSYEICRIYV